MTKSTERSGIKDQIFWSLLLLLFLAFLNFFSLSESRSESFDWCAELQKNYYNAAQQNCNLQRRTKASLSLKKSKKCSEKNCIYRLSFVSRKGSIEIYAGSGFTLITGDGPNTTTEDGLIDMIGARLIDKNHRTTNMGHCGGTACQGYEQYISGPLKGATINYIGFGDHGDCLLILPK